MSQQLTDPEPATPPAAPATRAWSSPTGWTVPIRATAAVLGVGMLTLGTINVASHFATQVDRDTTFHAGPIERVRVVNSEGDVTIWAGSAGTGATVNSRAQGSFRPARQDSQIVNGELQVNGGCPDRWILNNGCSVDFEITVPPGTAVDVNTSTGDLSVSGTNGPVTASSNTGSLRISRAGGQIRLNTDVGDVVGEFLAGGNVTAESDTGDVRLDFSAAPARLDAQTDVGDVRITVPNDTSGYRVSAETDLGEQHIDVPTDAASTRIVRLRTNTGDIRMGLGR